jgi:endonuclease/exonuclease/phosphatase family metal-dependent hydrolase
MLLVDRLTGPGVSLPQFSFTVEQLSVMTYNVLLPNSMDGWWTYKMYSPNVDPEVSSWQYRRNLLKGRIAEINADVVCLQEISPASFEDDFKFMWEDLGYDGYEMFKKGRFRPVTFWKTSHCRLASPPVHKDRSLITAFQKVKNNNNDNDNKPPYWYVTNCHLQAGQQGPRRVRQIHEAIKGVVTLAKKLKEDKPETNLRLVVCGDFNGGAEAGAIRFLEDGYVDSTLQEDGEPVTSSRKDLPLYNPLLDVSTAVTSRPPPPTLVVAELMSSLMDDPSYENPILSNDMKERLGRIYNTLATGEGGQMSKSDVEQWLIRINKELGRGDEYRNAAIQMGYVDPNPDDPWEVRKQRVELPEDGILTLEGFVQVYQKELSGGKFWGIAYDMEILGDPLPDVGLFVSRYDRIYYNGQHIQPVAVLDTTADKPCPNEKEASDHLPVAASFRVIE